MLKEDVMAPRTFPDAPEDDVQNEILLAVRKSLEEAASMIYPPRPLCGEGDEMSLQVEADRTALYLRGPTAFTA